MTAISGNNRILEGVFNAGKSIINNATSSVTRTLAFAIEFIHNPKELSWMGESSENSSKKIISAVTNSNKKDRIILDLGAGVGPTTVLLLKEMKENDHLTAIECMPKLAKLLQERVETVAKQLNLKKGQVEVFTGKIQEFSLKDRKADHIVCTIPLNNFSPAELNDFFQQVDNDLLADGGTFSYIELTGFPTLTSTCLKVLSMFYNKPYLRFSSLLKTKEEYLKGKFVREEIGWLNFPPRRVIHVSRQA